MSLEHHFNPEIAKIYGVDIAIFLHNIAYWVQKNLANDKHFHEGRYWTYNILDAFTIIFPYWSRRQIERIINNAVKKGVLLRGNFNKVKYDRKGWYALTDEAHKLLNIPISRNGEMDFTKRGNGFHQTVTPIADNNTDIKTDRVKKPSPTLFPKDFKFNDEHSVISNKYGMDLEMELNKFKTYYKGKRKSDWHNSFALWLLRSAEYKKNSNTSKNSKNIKQEEVIRPKMRDFTQERIDREAKEANKYVN